MRKKDKLTPLHFFENGPKMRKKYGLTNPFTFFENGPKMRKKHELTPLHFFENEHVLCLVCDKYQNFKKHAFFEFCTPGRAWYN